MSERWTTLEGRASNNSCDCQLCRTVARETEVEQRARREAIEECVRVVEEMLAIAVLSSTFPSTTMMVRKVDALAALRKLVEVEHEQA